VCSGGGGGGGGGTHGRAPSLVADATHTKVTRHRISCTMAAEDKGVGCMLLHPFKNGSRLECVAGGVAVGIALGVAFMQWKGGESLLF
jgi:hypothetical protein